jgi:hypothetical protein
MQNGSITLQDSQDTRDNLSYVNDVITESSYRGEYYVIIGANYMDENMVSDLFTNGYRITRLTNDMGTFINYKIEWSSPYTEEGFLQAESLLFITTEVGEYLDKD